jgi:hypothetical protein
MGGGSVSKHKAKELHANPLTAPKKKEPPKDTIPLWKVWKWSLRNPGVSPWKND